MKIPVVVFCAMALLLTNRAAAQSRLEGRVRDADGTPISAATVRIDGPDLAVPMSATADGDGRYAIENVKAGIRVRVVVLKEGRALARSFALVSLPVETVDLVVSLIAATPTDDEDLDPAGGPAGNVGGVVRSADRRPVAGARVHITRTSAETATDSAGRYAFPKLRAGLMVELTVTAGGFETLTRRLEVPNGSRGDLDFALDVAPGVAQSPAMLSAANMAIDTGRLTVRPSQAARVPALTTNEVTRALQLLPGVADTMEGSAELFVRGSTPDQNLMTLDGFTIYPLRHVFGRLSAFNGDAIETADFGRSVAAADGGRLGGALRLTGRSRAADRPTGGVDFSMLGGRAMFSTPIGPNGTMLVAARSLPSPYYDQVADVIASGGHPSARGTAARFSGGRFAAQAPSSFYDLNAKLEVGAPSGNRVSFSFYDGRDQTNNSRNFALSTATTGLTVPDGVLSSLPSDTLVNAPDMERWTGRGLSARWSRQWSSAVWSSLTVAHSDFFNSEERAWLLTSPSSGIDYSIGAGRGGSHAVVASNHVSETAVRFETAVDAGFDHRVTAGLEMAALAVDSTLQNEAVRNPEASSALVSVFSATDTTRVTTVYAQDAWRPVSALVVSLGIRATRDDLTMSTYADPRVAASYQVQPWLRLNGAWAVNHQAINAIAREDLMHGDGEVWALSNGATIPIARARQFSVGATATRSGVVVGLEAYQKTLDGLTMLAPRQLPGQTPPSAVLHHGSGVARGIELMAQDEIGSHALSVSYTASRVEYTYPTLESATFLAAQDQTHELKVSDAVRVPGEWIVGATWVGASGRPSTPALFVEPVWFASGGSAYRVVFGPKSSERLPPYHRLDLSTHRDFKVHRITSRIGVTLLNAYNHRNVWYRDIETAGTTLTTSEIGLTGRTLNMFVSIRL